jgi:hypothetical protein
VTNADDDDDNDDEHGLLGDLNHVLYGDREPRRFSPELLPEVERLSEEVMVGGYVRLLPAAFWQALDPDLLLFWCNMVARWTIVTEELIGWLRERIAGRRAIEVGAGNGDLGHYLGIPQTDSYAHETDPRLASRSFFAGGIPLSRPPANVRRLDAVKAVHALRPEVVVASWVTERGHKPGSPTYAHGVNEREIVQVADYVMIGNVNVHGEKKILALPHEEHSPPWLVSRANHPELNRMWCWKRRRR